MNHKAGSKVTAILLKGSILSIGGASAEEGLILLMQHLTFLKYPKGANLGAINAGHFWQFQPIPMSLKFNSHQFAFFSDLIRTTTSCEKKILAIDALLIKYFSFFVFIELALLADLVIELPCPDVCLSVCLFVNLDPPNYFF